jgi:hypothetical protein
LKSILTEACFPVPHIHDLNALVVSLPRPIVGLNEVLVSAAQCNPSVRYGQPAVSLEESVVAHHAALTIVRLVIDDLRCMKQAAGKDEGPVGGRPSADGSA